MDKFCQTKPAATQREIAIKRLLSRNVEEVIEKDHLQRVLASGKKLRVKLGIDPTSPDLHLGHAVVLGKMKEFQDLGHKVVLIIGDFTARIGDPSGQSVTRKPLSGGEIKSNMREYLRQAGKIINVKKAEVFYNSKWFESEGLEKIIALASAGTIQQVLRRADFKKRLSDDQDITILELLYPLLQGYDSVKIRAGVELGGTDQKFNLLMGRKIQRHFGMAEQDIMTMPLLEGTDGVRKMSKSYGNYIGLTEKPDNMFGKIMSLPDDLMRRYFMLCTNLEEREIDKLEKELRPRDLKMRLAVEIIQLYHGEKAAQKAAEKWEELFSKKEMPADLPALRLKKNKMSILEIILASGTAKSKGEARRLIMQGGFSVNGAVKNDPNETLLLSGGEAVKIGKKNFFRIKI